VNCRCNVALLPVEGIVLFLKANFTKNISTSYQHLLRHTVIL
jgi:hypothetical protein